MLKGPTWSLPSRSSQLGGGAGGRWAKAQKQIQVGEKGKCSREMKLVLGVGGC